MSFCGETVAPDFCARDTCFVFEEEVEVLCVGLPLEFLLALRGGVAAVDLRQYTEKGTPPRVALSGGC